MKTKKYSVWNKTDDIPASFEPLTMEEAEKFIREFPKKYERQGYYKTNRWEKISPASVVLKIFEI